MKPNKSMMTSEEAIKEYETEARKEEIRSECAQGKTEKALHKAKARKLNRVADAIRKLFGKKYHKADFTFDDDLT